MRQSVLMQCVRERIFLSFIVVLILIFCGWKGKLISFPLISSMNDFFIILWFDEIWICHHGNHHIWFFVYMLSCAKHSHHYNHQ